MAPKRRANSSRAATVSIAGDTLRYDAAPGETNEPQIIRTPIKGVASFRVTDALGAPMIAGDGCSAGLASSVKCPAAAITPRPSVTA